MTHVALTCPRLLFTIGCELTARPGHRDPHGDLARELLELGTVQRGSRDRWFVVELADSQDAILAYHVLHLRKRDALTMMSIVGSAAAAELFTASSVATAWNSVREGLFPLRADEGLPTDFERGIAAARHYTAIILRPVLDEISEDKLPEAPLRLWAVGLQQIIEVDHDPFTLGQLRFTRGLAGWRVEDRGGEETVLVNNQRSRQVELAPGMVLQLAFPHAFVVLR
jgi:hypothetical protein